MVICVYQKGRLKIIIARTVVFNEHNFPYLTAEKGSVLSDISGIKSTQQTVKTDTEQTQQENRDDEVQSQQEGNEQDSGVTQESLADYQLARDRIRREIVPPSRYVEADLIAYALSVVQQYEIPEQNNYEEAITG